MEEQLKNLIDEVRRHSTDSVQWRIAMHRLLIVLQKLPGIKKSNHPDYLQALNQTWEWVSRNISREFVPRSPSLEKSLVNWINGYLYWRIHDLYTAKTKEHMSLDVSVGNNEQQVAWVDKLSSTNFKTPTLHGLDGYIENIQTQKIQKIALSLEHYLEQDPDNKLLSCYPGNYSQCNCQLLAQKRYLQEPPDTFKSLAKQLNIPYRKLTNH